MQLATVSVNEDVDSGRVSVCAEIAVGVLQTDLTVTLSTTNGTKAGLQWWNVVWHFVEYLSHVYATAVLGEDFTEPSLLQVAFSSGDVVGDTACATFGIINDNNLEFDHEFTVNLESITPPGPVISNSSTATVSIMDDEGIYIALCHVQRLSICSVLAGFTCPISAF